MARVCFVLVAGLSRTLVSRASGLRILQNFAHATSLRPITPAVTCSMQATLTTGVMPSRHGIISNGLYTYNNHNIHHLLDSGSFSEFRRQISFWEQSAALIEAPRFWTGSAKRVAMLFWQQSIPDAADIILTPKPQHTPDGRTISSCWSRPADLYARLAAALGPFPLHHYWGPMASLASSEWIIRSAHDVWMHDRPDLQLVYVPHLDYSLQRLGPDHPQIASELVQVDQLLTPLIHRVRDDGGVAVVAGDYAMTAVMSAAVPNMALRRAGLLQTHPDGDGKLLIDYEASSAVAMVDHQIAHIYCRPQVLHTAAEVLRSLAGVDRIASTSEEKKVLGLDSTRSGDLILLSRKDAFFIHDWWFSDAEKPAWQFSVDIHRKPGYDPRELFFDSEHKCISQDPGMVKGSHGIVDSNPMNWPILYSDAPLPTAGGYFTSENCAAWLKKLLIS
jgi:predicted AlkP superfamily pyrophosphatase or phosphodiesterase